MEGLSRRAIRRCFVIPELVKLICSQVDVNISSGRSTLSALARTSLIFHEPALDCLWSSVEGIDCLIKCMPADLWREGYAENNQPTLHLTRPVLQSDLSRLRYYTHRIRKFEPLSTDYTDASIIEVCKALLLTLPNTLLPKLCMMSWRCIDEHVYPYIHLFLGPNLTELSILLDGSSIVQLSLLCTLPQRHPHIQRLYIHTLGSVTKELRDAMAAAVCVWHELRVLMVPYVTPTVLTHLANLPDLSTLTIQGASAHDDYLIIPKSLGFPALQTLTFGFCDGFKAAAAAIETMSSDSSLLKSLVVRYVRVSTIDNWKHIFSAAQKHCNHSLLRIISIVDDPIPGEFLRRLPMKINILRPLFVFSNLSKLILHPAGGIDINDADFRKLAQSWPCLKDLKLGMNFPGHPFPRITLSSLVYVAQHCPFLQTLHMLVDARASPTITDSRPGGGVRHTNLVSLGIGGSPIDSEAGVAVFLSDVFPRVISIETLLGGRFTTDQAIKGWNRVWQKVNHLLPILAAVRNQEKPESNSSLSDEEP